MKQLLRLTILAILLSACVTSQTSTPQQRSQLTKTLTPRPTSTRTPRPITLHACVTDSTIRVRRGPGKEYDVVAGMVSGTCMSILGRSKDSTWVYMASEDNKRGWVSADLLTIEGNLKRVSVRSAAQTLSLVPTAKITATSTRKPILFATNTPRPLLIEPTANNANCSPAYPGVCIPPRPPDLDCGDIPYKRFTVLSPDPHGFDRDNDGVGCES
jgi:hypothetical protein